MKSVPAFARALGLVALAAVLVALALPSLPLRAGEPASPGYTLDWWTVDGGGQTGGDGSGYDLQGSIGQPDAATWQGGSYTLAGGFWFGPPAGGLLPVYLPIVVR
jgi:hypothetical protein